MDFITKYSLCWNGFAKLGECRCSHGRLGGAREYCICAGNAFLTCDELLMALLKHNYIVNLGALVCV